MKDLKHPPCRTCGRPVHLAGARLCNGCWEVEYRLDEYLKSPKARKRVRALIDALEVKS